MSDIADLLREQAARLFEREIGRSGRSDVGEAEIPTALWQAIDAAGLCDVMVPEHADGAGAGLPEALVLARLTGAHAAPVPLVETALARWIAQGHGLPIASGAASLAIAGPESAGGLAITGIPWGRAVGTVIGFVEGPEGWNILAVDPARAAIERAGNLAGEPRDTLRLDAGALADTVRAPLDPALLPAGPLALLALFRAAQMSGAMATALGMATRYASDRVQFGRPIGRFQAIQQMLAAMAGEAAASACATDAAGLAGPDNAEIMMAAAKARSSEAAGHVAAGAHQVLGAIGYTREHDLHRYTRRLWAWRDEAGNEAYWQSRLFRLVAQRGPDLWTALAPVSRDAGQE
ncbi:MAG: acyl-CoA dehydrogenase family protein [Rhodobacteraceae bacterium]|nr:acyl-CoA dehydrogenase family protein [Paracoccaceae bacterium]